MNLFKVIFFGLLTASFSLAANVVTYTATSKVSQKDADKKAMEGVALQIGAQVKSSLETRTVEKEDGSIASTADSKKSVSTNVLLKSAKIQTGAKKNGMFQSTVTVDLDLLASKILLDLDQIKSQMKTKDSLIRLDMLDRDYRKMESEMILLEKLARSYNDQLENLSFVQKVPKELKLETTLGELTEFLVSSMQTVNFETEVSSGELRVTVSDFAGPIANFPLVLTQEKIEVDNAKTNAEGSAVFKLKNIKKLKPSGEVTVHADMNFRFVRQSALQNKVVSYGAQKTGKLYKLVCSGNSAECGALQKFLTDAGISIADRAGLPELVATLEFSDKVNSSRSLYTSRATIKLRSGDIEVVEQPQGVGRDEESAHVKAISKMSISRIESLR
ncbi:hypothetical protein [Fibrobacter sp.]|uniref:hypothetical protein n=1 Tax=Fibrobacter sp. TaxID=35828 RepID=UPI0025B91CBC|nr:hypothetical protein [Fibrobacter sp.]MBR3072820.1 hypothetical protein [Fibrobacter sp.]